jgi:hypothetical protein
MGGQYMKGRGVVTQFLEGSRNYRVGSNLTVVNHPPDQNLRIPEKNKEEK